jgi:IS5 family transposase
MQSARAVEPADVVADGGQQCLDVLGVVGRVGLQQEVSVGRPDAVRRLTNSAPGRGRRPAGTGTGGDRRRVPRPRQRAETLIADRGYDHDKYRRELGRRGLKPIIARRATEHGSGLGRLRWVIERTFA